VHSHALITSYDRAKHKNDKLAEISLGNVSSSSARIVTKNRSVRQDNVHYVTDAVNITIYPTYYPTFAPSHACARELQGHRFITACDRLVEIDECESHLYFTRSSHTAHRQKRRLR